MDRHEIRRDCTASLSLNSSSTPSIPRHNDVSLWSFDFFQHITHFCEHIFCYSAMPFLCRFYFRDHTYFRFYVTDSQQYDTSRFRMQHIFMFSFCSNYFHQKNGSYPPFLRLMKLFLHFVKIVVDASHILCYIFVIKRWSHRTVSSHTKWSNDNDKLSGIHPHRIR